MRKTAAILSISFVASLGACAPRGEQLLERADASLAEGDYRAAMIDLRNYVAKHPEDARARARLSVAMLEVGDLSGAEIEVAKARELGAERVDLVGPECRVLAASGAYEKVLEDCADTGDPGVDAELAATRGQALLALQRAAEARSSFEAALRARPDNLLAVEGLASAVFATDGAVAARKVFEAAPQPLREQARYWLALGTSEVRGGDMAAAEHALAKAVELSEGQEATRDHLAALAGLTEVQLRQGKAADAAVTSELLLKAAPKSPFAKAMRAQVLMASGDFNDARTLLEEAVSADPENPQARTMLGLVNMQLDNLGQAEMHLAQVVARDPGNVRAQQLLASVRTQLQNPETTLDALKPALEQPDISPELLTLAGRLSMQSGNRDEALQYLAQASEAAGKGGPEAQLDVAVAYIAAGDLAKATEVLEAMPQGRGTTALQRNTLLAAALLRQGEVSEAIALADSIVKESPDDAAARNIAGSVYAAAGKLDRARAEFLRVVELKPDDVGGRMNLARLDLVEGKPDAAAGQLQRALDRDPKNLLATLGMAAIAQSRGDRKDVDRWLTKAADDHPDSLQVRIAQVQHYLSTRDFTRAKAAADDAIRIDPNSAPAYNARGLVQVGQGDAAAGTASFREAVAKAPRGGYQLNLARAYLLDRKPEEALAVLDESLKSNPRQAVTLALAMSIAVQARDLERASGYMERLRAVEPEATMTLRLEGDLALAQGRFKDALAYYDKAAANGGDSSLAVARYRAGLLAGVSRPQRPLEEWLERNPKDPAALTLLAEHRQRAGDIDGAIAYYELAVSVVPGNVTALNNLAGLYQVRKDPKALAMAERALAAAPENPAVMDTVGWLLVERGDLDKALPLLREAAKALPNLPEVQYHYGAALARNGESAEARRILQQVADSKASPEVITGATRELATLK